MSSQTPNLDLVLPVGTENVSRQIINDNNTKIDTAVGLNSQAITNLNAKTFSEPANNTNFNNMTTAGAYRFSWIQDGTSYNRPVSTGGLLIVGTGYLVISQQYTDANGRVYVRGYSNSTWTSWQELATKSDFVIDSATSDNVNIAAGARTEVSVLASKTGYAPVGILGVYTPETQVMAITSYRISGSNATIGLYNTYNDTRNGKIIVRVLYQKT